MHHQSITFSLSGGVSGDVGDDVSIVLLRLGGGGGGERGAVAAAGGHAGDRVWLGARRGSVHRAVAGAAAAAATAGAAGRPGDGAPDGHGRHESSEHEPGADECLISPIDADRFNKVQNGPCGWRV